MKVVGLETMRPRRRRVSLPRVGLSAGGSALRPSLLQYFVPLHRAGMAIGLTFLLVLVVLGPFMTFRPGSNGEGSPLRQLLYFAAFGVMLAASRPWRDPLRLLPIAWPMVIVLAWCWISLSWSDVPELALRRLVLTTIIIWTLFAGVRGLGYPRALAIFRGVAAFALAANFLTVIFLPSYGIHQAIDSVDADAVGAWCGMMISKNFAGPMCAVTVLAFLFDPRGMPPWLRWGVIVAALIFLWGSESKTSAGIGLVAIGCGLAFMRYNPAYRALMVPIMLVLASAIALLVSLYWHRVEDLLYDPTAFTGRPVIWAALVAYHRDHFLGTGFGSFWNVGDGVGPIFQYGRGWITRISSGHNGYLDLLVQIGLPGVILTVLGLVIWPLWRLLSSMRISRSEGALLVSIVIFAAGQNLTESNLLDRDAIGHVVLMLAIALVAQVTRVPAQPIRVRHG